MGTPFSPENPSVFRDGQNHPEWRRAIESKDETEITEDDEVWMAKWLSENPGKSQHDATLALRSQRDVESGKQGNLS